MSYGVRSAVTATAELFRD